MISGMAQEVQITGGGGGLVGVADADVSLFKMGAGAAVATGKSAASTGAFSFASVNTAGQPYPGYIRGAKTAYRSTYLFPPNAMAASVTNLPLIMVSDALFGLVGSSQDDTVNGAVFAIVFDCKYTLIDGATLEVKQGGTAVGTVTDLGTLTSQAAGLWIASNVPDGATQITASYNGMQFPVHTVTAYKKANAGAPGTITATTVVPGYIAN